MKDLGKIKSLLSELTACVEAMEMGGKGAVDASPEGEKEEAADEDDGDDVAAKSLKMKMAKYKDLA